MGLRHIHIKYKIGVRGFPARGYFIPGRDGAGARWLGIVPCRRRATGVGWGDFSGSVDLSFFSWLCPRREISRHPWRLGGVKWALRIFLDRWCASMYPWRGCFSIP